MARHRTETRSHCPINFAAELFGDPWSLVVLRDVLLKGKRRYGELSASEERIASNVLADRLARLVDARILEKADDGGYHATPRGLDLIPVLVELAAWGARHDPDTASPRSFLRDYRRDREAVVEGFRAAARHRREKVPRGAGRNRPSGAK